MSFSPGQRCRIVSVHHPAFHREIGKRVVISRVLPDSRQAWVYEDRPATYRINRLGKRVLASDPRHIECLWGFDQLEPDYSVDPQPHADL
jgi:hypothetical protein